MGGGLAGRSAGPHPRSGGSLGPALGQSRGSLFGRISPTSRYILSHSLPFNSVRFLYQNPRESRAYFRHVEGHIRGGVIEMGAQRRGKSPICDADASDDDRDHAARQRPTGPEVPTRDWSAPHAALLRMRRSHARWQPPACHGPLGVVHGRHGQCRWDLMLVKQPAFVTQCIRVVTARHFRTEIQRDRRGSLSNWRGNPLTQTHQGLRSSCLTQHSYPREAKHDTQSPGRSAG